MHVQVTSVLRVRVCTYGTAHVTPEHYVRVHAQSPCIYMFLSFLLSSFLCVCIYFGVCKLYIAWQQTSISIQLVRKFSNVRKLYA